MSDGISAHGTILRRNGSAVADLGPVTPPALGGRKAIESTRHCDIDDTYEVGIRNAGPMTFEVPLYVAEDFITAWVTHLADSYELEFPDHTVFSFTGKVTNLGPSAHNEDELKATIVVQPSGTLTINSVTPLLLLEDGSGSYLTEAGDDIALE